MSEPSFAIELPHVNVWVPEGFVPPEGGPTIEEARLHLEALNHVDLAEWNEDERIIRLSVTHGSHVEFVRDAAFTVLETMFPQQIVLLHSSPRPS